ncbi:MAG: endolytic transglycosylase MltG [Actinomycetes bacterium]
MSGLGLEFEPDDHHEPSGNRARLLLVVGICIVLLLTVLGVAAKIGGHRLVGLLGPAADYNGNGSGSVTVTINPNASAARIGQALKDAGVVRSVQAFRDAADANPRSQSIQPGVYKLHKHMAADRALALLLDPGSRVFLRVVVPEGTRLSRIIQLIHAEAAIPTSDLNAAAHNVGALGLPAYAKGSLEGFLFPATYNFAPGTTAQQALKAMVDRFNQEATNDNLEKGAAALGYSPYDVVTVASLIEKEARLQKDYGKVARVAYNRLKPSWGQPFGFDSTLNYLLPERQGKLQSGDFQIDSPYNSRIHHGLPPTPIDSPGRAALMAALHPTAGPWLYFVTIDKAGNTAFETTKAQFDKDVRTSRANGVS